MPLVVTHPFVSGVSDSSDATRVRPSSWNASHTVTGTLDVSQGGTGQTTEAEALGEMIQALTQDSTPDIVADYVVTYDASADTGKKVQIQDIQAGRVVQTAVRTIYVRTTGNDSNDGSLDDDAHAFLTVNRAMNEAATIDVGDGNSYASSQFAVIVSLADGTYEEAVGLPQIFGTGLYSDDISGSEAIACLQSTSGNKASCIIDSTTVGDPAIQATHSWGWLIRDITIAGGDGGRVMWAVEGSILRLANMIVQGTGGSYGAFGGVQCFDHSEIYVCDSNVTFKGNFLNAIELSYDSIWYSFGRDIQLSGSVGITEAWVKIAHDSEYYGNSIIEGGGNVLFDVFGDPARGFVFSSSGGKIITEDASGGTAWDLAGNTAGMGVFGSAGTLATGVLQKGGSYNGLTVANVPVTFANRPAVAQHGMLVPFTDSTTTTWGATITGGGANKVIGAYNGTNWTVMGI